MNPSDREKPVSACECLATCPFYNDMMPAMPVTAARIKERYCLTDYKECARYMVFKALGRGKVPQDLFPVQHYRVEQIILYGTG